MGINAKNMYEETLLDGEKCIIIFTGGKHQVNAVVDEHTWQKYLHQYHWTATKNKNNYVTVKTSINKHSKSMYRMIIENEYSELDYWGRTIDHINNNPLDNRVSNLRIYNNKLNSTNVKSKYQDVGMQMIYPSYSQVNGTKVIAGYKLHTNVFDETIYKYFKTVDEAKKYRDSTVIPYIESKIIELTKKTRDIEFERGLRDKISSNEIDEIERILEKYNIVIRRK